MQLLCSYCNRANGTQGAHSRRLKMTELRAHNVATGVMLDKELATLTGERLASYLRGELQA